MFLVSWARRGYEKERRCEIASLSVILIFDRSNPISGWPGTAPCAIAYGYSINRGMLCIQLRKPPYALVLRLTD